MNPRCLFASNLSATILFCPFLDVLQKKFQKRNIFRLFMQKERFEKEKKEGCCSFPRIFVLPSFALASSVLEIERVLAQARRLEKRFRLLKNFSLGGWQTTAVAFSLLTQPPWVQISAYSIFSEIDVAKLIDCSVLLI